MEKKQIVPVYIETEPNESWEVRAEHQEGTLLGHIQHISYIFPLNLFLPKGEYWFIPEFQQSSFDIGLGKTKEKAFANFVNLYCDAEIQGV